MAAVAASALGAQATEAAEVTVAQGRLRGSVEDGLRVFRGVPFAQPPVGELRFRAPRPALHWTGVGPALEFAAASVQPGEKGLAQSEDCLYLNVWAPRQPPKGGAPVLVWIHGGGFTGGHSYEALEAGARFADAGIVCVTIAYRLGALGFLDVSPLLGPEYAGSADNGMRDAIAALGWVKENIHAFGGDPARVTVGGESAGAKLTDMLMGVPAAAGLFHQAISESGGAERIWPAACAAEVSAGFGQAWTKGSGQPVSALRTAPATRIVEVQEAFQKDWPVHFPYRAELDARLIPEMPLVAIRRGNTRGKRLLLGTNLDESAAFIGPHPKVDPSAKDLGNMTLEHFDKVAAGYARVYPEMPEDRRRVRSVTAEEYWVPSLRVAEAHVAGGGEAFVYRLDFPGTGRFAGLASHGYDLRFVWDFFGTETPSDAARALALAMHGAWVTFIRGEQPTGPGVPNWPRYDARDRATMIFDRTCRVENDPNARELALWDGLLEG